MSWSDGCVEGYGDGNPAFLIWVEDSGLGTHDHLVFFSLVQPTEVVLVLLDDQVRNAAADDVLKDLGGDGVGLNQVRVITRCANPTKGSKPERKYVAESQDNGNEANFLMTSLPHDVLHVWWVTEVDSALLVGPAHIRPGAAGLQEEGVAIIPEKEAWKKGEKIRACHHEKKHFVDWLFLKKMVACEQKVCGTKINHISLHCILTFSAQDKIVSNMLLLLNGDHAAWRKIKIFFCSLKIT